MKNKLIYLTLIMTFFILPLSASADGLVVKPLPNGDWIRIDENSQQAFINYEQGTEKLIIAVDPEQESSDIAWMIPVPGNPEKIEIDITSELPIFLGDDVISKAKFKFYEYFKFSYYAGLSGQIWTVPFSVIFTSMLGARGVLSDDIAPDDLASIETHIEKAGMVTEVITAKSGQAIYNYFSQKGFNIKEGNISELNSYIERDYSFVVSWIAPGIVSKETGGQRGIFISFPTSKIYYPLILTSAYGETEIPITIRVLGHIKPEIFPEIKSSTEISYFTERTKDFSGACDFRCQADMSQFRSILESYYNEYISYPSSIQELLDDEIYGSPTKTLIEDIKETCQAYPSYLSKKNNDYIMRLRLASGLFEINSSGFVGFTKQKKELFPSELQKFYGDKKPWAGEADYTKITINVPAKLLKEDLWMAEGKPFKISSALWITNNSLPIVISLYLLIVGLISFIAGGLAGLSCYHKFKKYALIGLGNIFTLIGLILTFNYVKKKTREDIKYSNLGFVSLFSVFFVSLLTFLSMNLTSPGNEAELWLTGIIVSVWAIISLAIFLLVKFILNKISSKNRAIRVFLAIILFIIFWIAIGLIGFLITIFL